MKTLFLDDEQCNLVREMLDFVPLTPRYMPLVVDLLQRIPESDADANPSADSAPAAPICSSKETAGGFSMLAHTERAVSMLDAINRALSTTYTTPQGKRL